MLKLSLECIEEYKKIKGPIYNIKNNPLLLQWVIILNRGPGGPLYFIVGD